MVAIIIGTEGGAGGLVVLFLLLCGLGLAAPPHGGVLAMDGLPFVQASSTPLLLFRPLLLLFDEKMKNP